ncbi:Hypothetical predicted protein [Olea europaea subsp. europaea]|uniref:Uncharacterized protein n=1 Tax=Olea europaea subsp. europaea TaxID=158383 RepID=A0A8S0P7C8_OLEEU|nr:Hypothetical predicted protein [Olea europaea subsp. europaea]
MEYIYNIDDRCDAKVTTRSNVSNVEKVYEALDNVHKEMFLKTCFSKLYDVRNMKISVQLIHNLLLRWVVSVNEDELWFCLGLEKAVRFCLYEFMLITGLSPANEKEYENQINEDGRLKNKYFPTSSKVWAFESIPRIANMYYARLPVNGLSRMCRWKSTLTPNSHDIAEVLDDPQLQARCSLKASPDETEQQYTNFFIQGTRKEDPILDVYLYEDGGYLDVDDAVLDDDLDPPQSQRERVSPNIREDDVCIFLMLNYNLL